MTHVVDGAIGCGAGLRVYDTSLGRMGVAVAEDIAFPEVIASLSACGSDFIVCPYARVMDGIPQTLLRAYAYLYGVPIFLCGIGYSLIADVDGNVAFASPQNVATFSFEGRKEYHLVEMRRRGLFHFHV
jgi:predicted amidohydrolase